MNPASTAHFVASATLGRSGSTNKTSAVLATVALLAAACIGTCANAQSAAAPEESGTLPSAATAVPAAPVFVGTATRALLTLQSGGTAASPAARPIAGDVATLSYQRYLDSFKQAIPASFMPTVNAGDSAR